jgi:hypothetical protein
MPLRQSGQGMEPAMPGTSYDLITEQRSSAHLTHSSCPQTDDRGARVSVASFVKRYGFRCSTKWLIDKPSAATSQDRSRQTAQASLSSTLPECSDDEYSDDDELRSRPPPHSLRVGHRSGFRRDDRLRCIVPCEVDHAGQRRGEVPGRRELWDRQVRLGRQDVLEPVASPRPRHVNREPPD